MVRVNFYNFHTVENSIFRKAEDDSIAYMVVIHINGNEITRHAHNRTIDFTEILPDFPTEGTIIAHTTFLSENAEHQIG